MTAVSSEMIVDMASSGCLDILVELKKSGNDMSLTSSVGLRSAAKNGHANVVKWYLDEVGIDNFMDIGASLIKASKSNHSSVVKELLPQVEKFVSVLSGEVESSLAHAAENDCDEIVEMLLPFSEGSIFSALENPLVRAGRRGNCAVVKKIFEMRFSGGLPHSEASFSDAASRALLASCRHGKLNAAIILLSFGVLELAFDGYLKKDRIRVLDNLAAAKCAYDASRLSLKAGVDALAERGGKKECL